MLRGRGLNVSLFSSAMLRINIIQMTHFISMEISEVILDFVSIFPFVVMAFSQFHDICSKMFPLWYIRHKCRVKYVCFKVHCQKKFGIVVA